MMQDVHIKLKTGLQEQKQRQQEECSFHWQAGLKFKEDTSKVLDLEHNFV